MMNWIWCFVLFLIAVAIIVLILCGVAIVACCTMDLCVDMLIKVKDKSIKLKGETERSKTWKIKDY